MSDAAGCPLPAACSPLASFSVDADTAGIGVDAYWPYMPYTTPGRNVAPYRSGEITRLNKEWLPWHWSGESAVVQNWDISTARSRDLARNDPTIVALKRAMLDHCVSTGITTSAAVLVGAEPQDDFDEESDLAYSDWCEMGCEADAEAKMAEPDLQRQMFSELMETGDALALRVQDPSPDRLIPLCYQVLEAEQLDRWKDRLPGLTSDGEKLNEIRAGIEYDERHRIVAYWLYKTNPYDVHARFPGVSFRVPAERIIHFSLPGRPSQTRSLGQFVAATQNARDLDNLVGSELTSAVIESLFSIVHKTKVPGPGLGFVGDGMTAGGSDDYGNPIVRLGRGIVSQIPIGDEIETVTKQRNAGNLETMTRLLVNLIGMAGGCSRYRITKDYTGTTYIAARASGNDDARGFRPLQRWFGRQWSMRVRQDWTAQMAAYGRFSTLTPTLFAKQRRRWLRCELQYPGVEQLDQVAETNASIARIASGLSTRQIEAGYLGRNVRAIDRQRRRELDHERALGLNYDVSRPGTAGATNAGNAQDRADTADTTTGG